jgi:hypothetical protein
MQRICGARSERIAPLKHESAQARIARAAQAAAQKHGKLSAATPPLWP